jgi:hypothetical protein
VACFNLFSICGFMQQCLYCCVIVHESCCGDFIH